MDILAAYRGAAEICGTTHKTVRRVVERHNAGGSAPERKRCGRNYEEVRGLVASRVRSSRGRIPAKRLLPAARTAGYAGSARNFRRLVAEVKAAWRAGHHRGRRPAVWTPSDTLVIDWGSAGGLHVFCAGAQPFGPDDQPHPLGPAGQVDGPRQLVHPALSRGRPSVS